MDAQISCIFCNNIANVDTSNENVTVRGVQITLENVETVHCVNCGQEYHTPEATLAMENQMDIKVREARGLLTPAEMKAIRKLGKWTQSEFVAHFGVGEKTVSRWENGAVFQALETDRKYRAIRDSVQNKTLYLDFPDLALKWRGEMDMPRVKKINLIQSFSPIPSRKSKGDNEPTWNVDISADRYLKVA